MADDESREEPDAPVVPLTSAAEPAWVPAPEYGPGHRRDARTGEVCYSDSWLESEPNGA